MKRLTVPFAILAAFVAGLVASHAVSTAQAQATPATAACTIVTSPSDKKAEAWMNEQIAAGRTHFVTSNVTFCAW